MAAQGATALFVPTNNGLPAARASAALVAQARNVDIARAVENSMWVIRADVAGSNGELVSYGSSGIVDPDGMVVQSARQMSDDLIVAEINTVPPAQRRGWDASRNRAVMDAYAAHVDWRQARAGSRSTTARSTRLEARVVVGRLAGGRRRCGNGKSPGFLTFARFARSRNSDSGWSEKASIS